jgi:flagellar basal-body rod protein FlgF
MNRGIYAVALGMRAMLELQGRLANNLANVHTPAFKQEIPVLTPAGDLLVARAEGQVITTTVGPVGIGVYQGEEQLDLSQGPLEPSDHPLSLAISGDAFFRVQTPEGERYTRNGNFGRDAAGYLVTSQGYYVLGENGPIQLPEGDLTIDGNGTIWSGQTRVTRLALARFAGPEMLQRAGQGLFIGQNPQPVPAGEVTVHQGYLERANIDVTGTLITMMTALKSYESAQKLLKMQDEMLARLMDLGRIS